MPVKADHIAASTASDPVLQQVLRRVWHGWGDRCHDKGLEPFYVRRNELSTSSGCISWGNRVVIPVRGEKQLIEDLLTAHPGVIRWKIWRGATYGGQGWIQKLRIRSSHAKYVNFIELHLRIPGSGLKSAGPAYMQTMQGHLWDSYSAILKKKAHMSVVWAYVSLCLYLLGCVLQGPLGWRYHGLMAKERMRFRNLNMTLLCLRSNKGTLRLPSWFFTILSSFITAEGV